MNVCPLLEGAFFWPPFNFEDPPFFRWKQGSLSSRYYIYNIHKIADFVCKYFCVCCFLRSEVLSHESSRHSNELPKAEELCTTGRAVASLLGVSTEGNQIRESDLSWPPKLPEKPWRRRTCFFVCLIYTTESSRGGIFLCFAWWPNLFFSAYLVHASHGNIVGTCRYLRSTPHPGCNRGKWRFIPGYPKLTWLAGKWTCWRCHVFPIKKNGDFSIAMLVYLGGYYFPFRKYFFKGRTHWHGCLGVG